MIGYERLGNAGNRFCDDLYAICVGAGTGSDTHPGSERLLKADVPPVG